MFHWRRSNFWANTNETKRYFEFDPPENRNVTFARRFGYTARLSSATLFPIIFPDIRVMDAYLRICTCYVETMELKAQRNDVEFEEEL